MNELTLESLARRVEALERALDLTLRSRAEQTTPPSEVPINDWQKQFDAWMAEVQARAPRYPAGFVMDDRRESIYDGCGE